MYPFMYEFYNAMYGETTPKVKKQKPDIYYVNIPKSERKKIGTGTYRNGKEIMNTAKRESKQ